MDLEMVAKQLGRIRVDIEFIATDPTPGLPQEPDIEKLRLTACLDRWSKELLHRMLTPPFDTTHSHRGKIIVAIVGAFQKSFSDLPISQIKWTLHDDVPHDGDVESSPIHIRFEVRAAWGQIEELEEAAVVYLAELFDGHAVLTLEEARGMETTTLELSSGSLETEMPIFGQRVSVELAILDSLGRRFELSLDAGSTAIFKILNAAPAAMRSTPGGRRTLALLFLEGALEEAVDRGGDCDGEWSLTDWTQAGRNLIEARGLTFSTEMTAGEVARYIQGKWPDIFVSR